jgi:predicted acylesterase/phospholipase RssA
MSKALCLSSGGVKGIAILGALHCLYEKQILDYKNIEVFIGTSIGSIIALLLSIDYTPNELFESVVQIESPFSENTLLSVWERIKGFMDNFGLLSLKPMENIVAKLIIKKLGTVPTLKELYVITKKQFICVTTNCTNMREEYLYHETFPDLLCTEAISMSCNIPLIFEKIKYNNNYYVDGGITDPFPINFTRKIFSGEIIGVEVIEDCILEDNLLSYIYTIFSTPLMKIKNTITDEKMKIISIKLKEKFSLKPTLDKKIELFILGYLNSDGIGTLAESL